MVRSSGHALHVPTEVDESTAGTQPGSRGIHAIEDSDFAALSNTTGPQPEALGRRLIASSSSGRRNRQVRPSLRPGRMPRRANSLTVYGLRSVLDGYGVSGGLSGRARRARTAAAPGRCSPTQGATD
jgi:hypothetical protein